MPYERRPLKVRSLAPLRSIAKVLAARGVNPNHVSLLGVVPAVAGFVCLWGAGRGWLNGWFFVLLAAVCVFLRLFCNVLDGMIAIDFDRATKAGDIFNEIPNRFSDTLFLVGAGYLAHSPELGWIAAVLAVFTAYTRTFGASLGQSHDYGGPCAQPGRMLVLAAGLIAAVIGHFADLEFRIVRITLWIIIAGTALTAFLRLRRLYRALP